jgi:hypothetical protein
MTQTNEGLFLQDDGQWVWREKAPTELKYETWPSLTPIAEDVARFQSLIADESQKRRPNHKIIEAATRDIAIAQTLVISVTAQIQ